MVKKYRVKASFFFDDLILNFVYEKKFLFNLIIILIMINNITSKISAQTPVYLDTTASIDQRVNDLIGKMTIEEKIGQMMQVDHTTLVNNLPDITNYFIGSALSGGDSENGDNKTSTWADLYDTLQSYALKTRLKIPLIYGIDAVHGNNNIYGATIFPHNIGLGCTRDPKLIEEAAEIIAKEIAATGIDWTFAPCAAVPRDERWGRFYEGFGGKPDLVQPLGDAEINGFQGENSKDHIDILACAKHYLGDGGTLNGIDQGNTIASEEEIRDTYLPPYISAIKSGVGSVMVSYSSINGKKMHGNKFWLTDVLKKELGFKGFVISDWGGVDQLSGDYKQALEIAINAGVDMVMLPHRYKDFFTYIEELINEGKISIVRINDAIRRILRIKFMLGVFEKPYADKSLIDSVGSEEHRKVARQCVRESLVLLKKKNGILPIPKKDVRILVAGSHADNLGYQCGGWTISWQGDSGITTIGTTILQGMKKIAPSADFEFSEQGNFRNTKADYSVVVIGEKPYAEMKGDNPNPIVSNEDLELIKKMKSYSHPVIVILISGRPLIIQKILHFTDVLFAAWLPGTEGDGIAQVLYGDYKPHGVLSHAWPRNLQQIPFDYSDKNANPLFPYGYGITSFDDSPKGSSPQYLS